MFKEGRPGYIYRLEQGEEIIEGEENLEKYIRKYYKSFFGSAEKDDFALDETRREDIPQVLEEENIALIEEFSEKSERQFSK